MKGCMEEMVEEMEVEMEVQVAEDSARQIVL